MGSSPSGSDFAIAKGFCNASTNNAVLTGDSYETTISCLHIVTAVPAVRNNPAAGASTSAAHARQDSQNHLNLPPLSDRRFADLGRWQRYSHRGKVHRAYRRDHVLLRTGVRRSVVEPN